MAPDSLADALALLAEKRPNTHVLAGGTDLFVGLRNGKLKPGLVIDIKRADELSAPIEEIDGTFRISATCVMSDLIEDERISGHFPALVEAARVVGSVAIRNRATLAGNICNASPAADTAPALLVYGAHVGLMSEAGTRRMPLDEFFVGPGETQIQPGELVTDISLPIPTRPAGSAFARMTRRRGVDLATVNLCCLVDASGVTTFAYGAAGPRPFLVRDETGVLADRDGSEADRESAIRALTAHARPITDVRGSAEYRQAMLEVLSRRALNRAMEHLVAS